MNTLRTLSTAGIIGFTALAGCSSGDHHASRDYDYGSARSSSDRVERDSGTTSRVPRDARVVDEGRGGALGFTARDRGQVYLVDESAGAVVWDSSVRDGDRVTVVPDKNRIEINGKEQAKIDLKSKDRFQLYYLSSDNRGSRY
jgi:hypothetical protein